MKPKTKAVKEPKRAPRHWEHWTTSYTLVVPKEGDPYRTILLMITKTIFAQSTQGGYEWAVCCESDRRDGTAASAQEALDAGVREARLMEPSIRHLAAPALRS